jgi:hypothetical protein
MYKPAERIRQMAERQEAEITVIEEEWGKPVDPERVAAALKQNAYKLVALVHAETSTGVLQPIEDIARLAKESGTINFGILEYWSVGVLTKGLTSFFSTLQYAITPRPRLPRAFDNL